MSEGDTRRSSDVILIIWLLADVTASLLLLFGCAYIVFWRGRSGWWFVMAFMISCCFGGKNLYARLAERTKLAEVPSGK